jgi:arginine decarboxylase-like protein
MLAKDIVEVSPVATTDWNRLGEESLKNSLEMQKALWDRWQESARSMTQAMAADERDRRFKELVDGWQEYVQTVIDLPVAQTRAWAEGLGQRKDAPKEVVETAKQLQETAGRWSEVQKQLADAWFNMVRSSRPASTGIDWQSLTDSWQEASRRTLEAQREWMTMWSPDRGERRPGSGA